ncbi:HlyD family efflux transporter periplasmic adaptor subunit [Anabaena sphaerica FACHB-251]|uniref:HlyD family efflux transporter periplasmic adaptor subunit n=2 Tax=Anabaena TaxID=1163 RepID=A0A927A3M3_9NOST|nr:HlyD family efflux transporter periplasmic adaptor subunit [Anabaena sphaerica FACHB-251]
MIISGILKYKVIIKAPATVRPMGELRLVQAITEGTIKSMNVKNNQVVKKGDVLAKIDDYRWQIQKQQLLTNIQKTKLQLSQIDAQIRALDGQIQAESDRNQRDIIASKAELSRSQRDFQDQKISSLAQVQEGEANSQQAEKELQITKIKLKSAIANVKSGEAAFKAAKARRDRYKPLAETGSISIDQLQEAQLAVEQQEQLLVSQQATVEEYREAIAQQQQAVEAAKARQQALLTGLNPNNANVIIAQEKIAAQIATGKFSLAHLNREREELIQQKLEIQKQINTSLQELQQVNQEIANTVIKAAVSGTIQELNLRNTAQVLRSGDIVAQIAPSESPLIFKAWVTSADIPQVTKGQDVKLRVSGCSYTDFGTLKGEVSEISPDVISYTSQQKTLPGKTSFSGSATYEVTIQPESLVLSAANHQCTIQSGMEAIADIISTEETVLKFLLKKARLLTDFSNRAK